MYCPEYFIDAINQNSVVRHILITNCNLIFLKPNRLDKSPSLSVFSVEMIWQEGPLIVLLLVSMFWGRVNIYKHSKWRFSQILHQIMVQKIIQCHENNIWQQMCIIIYANVLLSIIDTHRKGKIRSKCSCKLYITNWSFSKKVEIFVLCNREWYWRGHLGMYQVHNCLSQVHFIVYQLHD